MTAMGNLPKLLDQLPTDVVVEIRVCVHASGALSVHGPIHDKPWMIAALSNAIDAVRNHGGPREIVVPGKDVSLS